MSESSGSDSSLRERIASLERELEEAREAIIKPPRVSVETIGRQARNYHVRRFVLQLIIAYRTPRHRQRRILITMVVPQMSCSSIQKKNKGNISSADNLTHINLVASIVSSINTTFMNSLNVPSSANGISMVKFTVKQKNVSPPDSNYSSTFFLSELSINLRNPLPKTRLEWDWPSIS